MRFCRRRPDKRVHAIELGLSHFIDDRRDVLAALVGAVPHLYLFGAQREAHAPTFAKHVADWSVACDAVLGDLQGRQLEARPA